MQGSSCSGHFGFGIQRTYCRHFSFRALPRYQPRFCVKLTRPESGTKRGTSFPGPFPYPAPALGTRSMSGDMHFYYSCKAYMTALPCFSSFALLLWKLSCVVVNVFTDEANSLRAFILLKRETLNGRRKLIVDSNFRQSN